MKDTINEIISRKGSPPWREKILATPRIRMLVHCWPVGFGHPEHYHPKADEVWYIYDGKLKVKIDSGDEIIAKRGSILFAKRGTSHDMISLGKKPLIMLVFVAPNQPDDEISLSSEKVEFPD